MKSNLKNQSGSIGEKTLNIDQSQNLLEVVCNNATVSLFIMDEHQHCVYMNPAAEALTGFQLDEAKGKPLHDLIHHTKPDGSPYPLHECPIDQAFPQNNQERGEEVFVHRDGHFYPVSFTASPIRNREGQPVGTVIEVMDISAKKTSEKEFEKQNHELNQSLETLRTLNTLGALVSGELELDKLVQSITDVATKLCGAQFGALFYNIINSAGESYTLYTISGVPREEFSKFPMPRNTQVFAPTFAGQGVVRSDDITKDPRYGKNKPYHGMPKGHLPVVSYLAVPVISRSGEVIGGLFFGHSNPASFTQRHEDLLVGVAAQAAIAIDNARLYKKAQDAIHARDEFLSIASHELKTPLTSLKLQAQLHRRAILRKDPIAYDPKNVDEIIDLTEKQITRLNRLVDDMLDVSRIRSGKLKIVRETLNLNDLVQETVKRLHDQFKNASYELPVIRNCLNPTGNWDRLRVEQILTNLLTNAIRYGNKKPIEVILESDEHQVLMKIQDHGIGISEAAMKKIFDRFERAVDANEVSGLGLGLFITKQLVLAHGGLLWVESEIGLGSTFFVQLPRFDKADQNA